MKTITRALLTVAVLTLAGQAQAAIISYASRAAFDAAVAGLVTEGWEGAAAGTVIPNGSSFGGIVHTSSVGDALIVTGFSATSSPNSLGRTGAGFFLPADLMTFGFGGPIVAFGIDINTAALTAGANTATTNLGDVVASTFDPFPGTGLGQFIGFVSTLPFTSVTISGAGAPNFAYTLDSLRYPRPSVPEPLSIALVAFGLFAVGLRRARR
jgi:hypothetical protein